MPKSMKRTNLYRYYKKLYKLAVAVNYIKLYDHLTPPLPIIKNKGLKIFLRTNLMLILGKAKLSKRVKITVG